MLSPPFLLKGTSSAFRIAPEYRGENLAGRMISEVLGFLSEKKIYRLKVYTKPENSEVFKALGFSEIISTTNISLLETPPGTIWNVLNDLKSEYNVVEDDIGCAVLNANPFTLGHRYLVETASNAIRDSWSLFWKRIYPSSNSMTGSGL